MGQMCVCVCALTFTLIFTFEEKSLPFAEPQFLVCQMGMMGSGSSRTFECVGADEERKF